MTRELRDGDVHPQADAEIRNLLLAGDSTGQELALPAAGTEAPGYEDAVDLLQQPRRLLQGHPFGVDPAHVHGASVMRARVLESFVNGQVGVLQLDVFADQRDLDHRLAPLDALGQVEPLAEIGLARREVELLRDEAVQSLRLEPRRHQVDVRDVRARHDRVRLHVCEEGDLLANVRRELLVRAADDDVGMNTDAAQLVDRVLRGLGLELAGRLEKQHERDMEIEHVLGTHLAPELPDRLEERQRLDVSDRSSDLADHNVGRSRHRARPDTRLDLVRDVRNHLDGRAQELALALLA